MSPPISAPYATALCPSNGPPCSFTVMLPDGLVTCSDRTPRSCGPFGPARRRCGSSQPCPAWDPAASARLVTPRAGRLPLLEAVAAVHRLVAAGLERHTGLLAAAGARRGEHLTIATATATTASAVAGAMRRAAGGAAGRRVLQAAGLVELLLA